MKTTIITGGPRSGKTKQYEDLLKGKKFLLISANQLNDKHCYEGIAEDGDVNIVIDEITSEHLARIKHKFYPDGVISYRRPYTMDPKEYKITNLILVSQSDISKYIRSEHSHIKL